LDKKKKLGHILGDFLQADLVTLLVTLVDYYSRWNRRKLFHVKRINDESPATLIR
jgi:hypothetical protein